MNDIFNIISITESSEYVMKLVVKIIIAIINKNGVNLILIISKLNSHSIDSISTEIQQRI